MGSRKNGRSIFINPTFLQDIDPNFEYHEITKELRNYVLTRDNDLCQLCGGAGDHTHHVLYKSLGGKNTANNLITLCEIHHTGNEGVHGKLGSMRALLQDKIARNEEKLRRKLNNSYTKRIL
jgi:5-methylcytosine-specific restriction endonuclease McrA